MWRFKNEYFPQSMGSLFPISEKHSSSWEIVRVKLLGRHFLILVPNQKQYQLGCKRRYTSKYFLFPILDVSEFSPIKDLFWLTSSASWHIAFIFLTLQAHQLLMNFEEPLKDYVRAVQSIKARFFINLHSIPLLFYFFHSIRFITFPLNNWPCFLL